MKRVPGPEHCLSFGLHPRPLLVKPLLFPVLLLSFLSQRGRHCEFSFPLCTRCPNARGLPWCVCGSLLCRGPLAPVSGLGKLPLRGLRCRMAGAHGASPRCVCASPRPPHCWTKEASATTVQRSTGFSLFFFLSFSAICFWFFPFFVSRVLSSPCS